MQHIEFLPEGVGHHLAVDSGPPLDEARRIIDAGVDHLAVVRTGPRANGAFCLDDDHFAAAARQRSRDRKADHARADNEIVDRGHASALRYICNGIGPARYLDGAPPRAPRNRWDLAGLTMFDSRRSRRGVGAVLGLE